MIIKAKQEHMGRDQIKNFHISFVPEIRLIACAWMTTSLPSSTRPGAQVATRYPT